MTDVADIALSQAIVCAYAVPAVGPVVAATASILQAVYDAAKTGDVPPGQYSAAQAISDLGAKMATLIHSEDVADELHTIKGWQLALADAHTTTPGYAVTGAMAFLADHDFNKTFGALLDSDPDSEERVKDLGTHFLARITYHSLCNEWLDRLEAARATDPIKVVTPITEIRTRYLKSLTDAVTFARETVHTLDETYRHAREKAEPPATLFDGLEPAMSMNLARAQRLRRIRRDGHLQFVTPSDIHTWRQYIVLFDTTIASLQAVLHPAPLFNPPAPAPAPVGNEHAPTGTVTVTGPSLRTVTETRTLPWTAVRPAGVARFLFESAPGGGWMDVLDDSAVSPGALVTQNAGSTGAKMYYRVDGGGLNGIVADALDKADQRTDVNADLVTAYDARYGAGAYDADSAGPSPRQDRLTSFLVLLANGVPPIGDSVYGLLYSVGPQLGSTGIDDPEAYKKIYSDGLAAIADWNRNNTTPFVNLRLTLLSTGIYAGGSDGKALRAQAAGLVVDAVVAAMRTAPELASLTLLVNTNDTDIADGDERVAFEAVATARSITTHREGFDVPLS